MFECHHHVIVKVWVSFGAPVSRFSKSTRICVGNSTSLFGLLFDHLSEFYIPQRGPFTLATKTFYTGSVTVYISNERLTYKYNFRESPLLAYVFFRRLFKHPQCSYNLLVNVSSFRVETGSSKLSVSGVFLDPILERCVLGLSVDL